MEVVDSPTKMTWAKTDHIYEVELLPLPCYVVQFLANNEVFVG